MLSGLVKWENFRVRREKGISDYILKKNIVCSARMYTRLFMFRCVLKEIRGKVRHAVWIRCRKLTF
jgi:hypothetical protein